MVFAQEPPLRDRISVVQKGISKPSRCPAPGARSGLPPEPVGSVAPVQSSRTQSPRSVWPSTGTADGSLTA